MVSKEYYIYKIIVPFNTIFGHVCACKASIILSIPYVLCSESHSNFSMEFCCSSTNSNLLFIHHAITVMHYKNKDKNISMNLKIMLYALTFVFNIHIRYYITR